jgi:hypothetical protein
MAGSAPSSQTTRRRGRSRFGAAQACVPIRFREHLSNNHFHENFSNKKRQIVPIKSEAGVRQCRVWASAAIHRKFGVKRLDSQPQKDYQPQVVSCHLTR